MVRQILLVEDNQDDVDLTLRAFHRTNVSGQIAVAHDGVEALDYLLLTTEERGTRTLPQLVLLDLNLPRVDGFEVLRRMRTDPATKCLPVVVLTSSLEASDLASCYALGANSYVRKPVDFQEFQEAVQQIATYWLLLNHTPAHL